MENEIVIDTFGEFFVLIAILAIPIIILIVIIIAILIMIHYFDTKKPQKNGAKSASSAVDVNARQLREQKIKQLKSKNLKFCPYCLETNVRLVQVYMKDDMLGRHKEGIFQCEKCNRTYEEKV